MLILQQSPAARHAVRPVGDQHSFIEGEYGGSQPRKQQAFCAYTVAAGQNGEGDSNRPYVLSVPVSPAQPVNVVKPPVQA